MKYWLGFKVLSLLLDFFAQRNDNKVTQEAADFLKDTLDKTKPTDLRTWQTLKEILPEQEK